MQVELSELQRRLGATFVHVTHSQEEALTMSDRVILMREGRIEQQGPPRELFEHPRTRFVADFMGVENILDGVLVAQSGERASLRIGEAVVRGTFRGHEALSAGTPVCAAVRAEKVRFTDVAETTGDEINRFACRAASTVYKGKYYDLGVDTEIGRLSGRIWDPGDERLSPAQVTWRVDDCIVVPRD